MPFKIDCWWHNADTVDGLTIQATERLEIAAQQVGRTDTDRRPENGTVILWEFRQDRQRSLGRQDRHHLDGAAQPF